MDSKSGKPPEDSATSHSSFSRIKFKIFPSKRVKAANDNEKDTNVEGQVDSRSVTINEKSSDTGHDNGKGNGKDKDKTKTKGKGKGKGGKEEEKKDDQPPALPPVSLFKLFRFTTRLETFLNFVGLALACASGSAQPLMTLLFGRLTNAFVDFGRAALNQSTNPDPEALAAAGKQFRAAAANNALYIVFIGIGMWFTTYFYMLIWIWTSERASKRLREAYLRAILRQDIAFFDNVGAGEVATRIQSDTHLVQMGISEKVPIAVNWISTFIAGFVIAFVRSWKLALALTSMLPCIALCGAFINKVGSSSKVKQLNLQAESGTIAEEVISTIRTSHAFGISTTLAGLFNQKVEAAHRLERKMALGMGPGMGSFIFVIYSSYALAFYFGTTLALRGEANVGVVINVLMSIMIGSFSLLLLAPEAQAITSACGAAPKLFQTIDRVPPIDSASPAGLKPDPSTVKGEVTVHGVTFKYPSRPEVTVLKNIDLEFEAGKTTALVGASGSGKSTIVALVERFYDPVPNTGADVEKETEALTDGTDEVSEAPKVESVVTVATGSVGSIKMDGIDLKDLNLKWLRSQIGYVAQEPTLFSTTIRQNVEFGMIGSPLEHLSASEKLELVKKACEEANAAGFIEQLPKKYETMVGERGYLLSGGQKQRIAIARAIVKDPKILLLDEATSALDTKSEGIVQDALDKAATGRTTIVIAHRLSTIKDADKIYVMGEGKVIEVGTHQELLARDSAYARLVFAQRLREKEGTEADVNVDEIPDPDSPIAGFHQAHRTDTLDRQKLEAIAAEAAMEAAQEQDEEDGTGTGNAKTKTKGKGKKKEKDEDLPDYSLLYLGKRLAIINWSSLDLYGWAFLAAAASGVAFPAFGFIYGPALSGFEKTGADLRKSGDRAALWFFIIAIGSALAATVQYIAAIRAAADLTAHVRRMLFRAILRQDISFFDNEKHSTGGLTSGLSENPQKINGVAGITLAGIVQGIFTLLAASIIGLAYGWKLALIGIACLPTVLGAGYIRLKVVTLKDKINKSNHEGSAQVACEAAGAIRTVASLNREDDCVRRYSKSLEVPLKKSYRAGIYGTFWFALSQATVMFVVALVFWYGSRLVSTQEYSVQQFYIILMSVTFGGSQAGNIFAWAPDISNSKVASTRIIHLFDSVPKIDSESKEGQVLENVKGSVTLENVHFRYPTRPTVPVLNGLSLTASAGSHVALVGASGCGKSTVIQLIERFYDPAQGRILIDGHDIRELNVSEYRKHIALVSQEPTLYSGSIKFNILLGATKPMEEVTQEELESVCKQANILEFIQSLPEGFETPVGGKGSQLSGGQKQRIAIARALIRNPAVLLLDEATSALDSSSERVVQEALDAAARGRTTISIAHRLSTIQRSDCIYFVEDGKIVEKGKHEELISLNGKYAQYVMLQDLSRK